MATKLFVLFLGLAFTYVGNSYRSLSRRMRSFSSVPGKVIAREILAVTNTRTGRWGEGGGYSPQVTYRYVVDGVELESNKLGAALYGYKRAVAERKLNEIPEQVVVWYDPKEPSVAYLRKHTPGLGYFILFVGVSFVIGAAIGLIG